MNQFIAAIGFGVVTSSILALGAVGFTLQFGVTNVLNLAYADVMIATAFVAYLVAHAGGDLVVAMFVAGAVFGAVASALLNRAVFSPFIRRGTGPFGMIVVAIGVSVMLENGLLAFIGPNFFSLPFNQGRSFHWGAMVFTSLQLVIVGVAVVAMLAVHGVLRHTRIGKAMRATSADTELARGCGVADQPNRRYRLADIGGALRTCGRGARAERRHFRYVDGVRIPCADHRCRGPRRRWGHLTVRCSLALVVGMASELSTVFVQPEWNTTVAFVLLIVVLLVRPQGILSDIASSRELAT